LGVKESDHILNCY